MTRLPALSARQLLSALQRAGFEVVRTSGSHQVLVHQSDARRRAVVPVHRGRDLPRGTLQGVLSQAGLTADDLLKLLR